MVVGYFAIVDSYRNSFIDYIYCNYNICYKTMSRILLIVDPQIDFICGSLAVKGAEEKMNALASALQNESINYDCVIVTKDYHPSTHCSFEENGGQWPTHCVIGTVGSCVYPPLWNVLNKYNIRIFTKGINSDKEEYSIFDNSTNYDSISNILGGEIRVVGIAGDYCVYETICSLISMGYRNDIVVDTKYIASIDGGDKLSKLINTYKLAQIK